MCYADGARPPLPPVRGGATDSRDFGLQSDDGTDFAAFYAHPDRPSYVAVVILPDVRGLHPFYKDLAKRFAEAGLHAVAIDYFGRTAASSPRGDDFPFREHLEKLEFEHVAEDVRAAVRWLRGIGSVRAVFTVGFCLGGTMSWRQAAGGHGLAGCVGFYGRPDQARPVIGAMSAPLLLLAAGQDHTPVADVEAFATEIRNAGGEAELHVYPHATHSFFDRRLEEFNDECDDAWRRILDFVSRHRSA